MNNDIFNENTIKYFKEFVEQKQILHEEEYFNGTFQFVKSVTEVNNLFFEKNDISLTELIQMFIDLLIKLAKIEIPFIKISPIRFKDNLKNWLTNIIEVLKEFKKNNENLIVILKNINSYSLEFFFWKLRRNLKIKLNII